MNTVRDDIKWYMAVGFAGGMFVYAIDCMFRLVRTETRAYAAERDSQYFRRLYSNESSRCADLQAKIHELEWQLNSKEEP